MIFHYIMEAISYSQVQLNITHTVYSTHLDGGDGKRDFASSVDVRVENTQNVLELLWNDERLRTHTHTHTHTGSTQ